MKSQINIRVSDMARRQLDQLTAHMGTSITETITVAIDRLAKQELSMNTQTTVTLKFVAQNGHAWEETVDQDDIESTIATTVATHGDIERIEKLDDPDDMCGDIIWRFE